MNKKFSELLLRSYRAIAGYQEGNNLVMIRRVALPFVITAKTDVLAGYEAEWNGHQAEWEVESLSTSGGSFMYFPDTTIEGDDILTWFHKEFWGDMQVDLDEFLERCEQCGYHKEECECD